MPLSEKERAFGERFMEIQDEKNRKAEESWRRSKPRKNNGGGNDGKNPWWVTVGFVIVGFIILRACNG